MGAPQICQGNGPIYPDGKHDYLSASCVAIAEKVRLRWPGTPTNGVLWQLCKAHQTQAHDAGWQVVKVEEA